MMQIDHPQCIENSSSHFFSLDAEDVKHDSNILKDLFMKKQTKVLKHDPYGSPQLINSVIRNPQDISSIDDDLPLGGKYLAENDLEQSRFA
jgi:hypothetical protein